MPLDALATIPTLIKVATEKAAGICGDDIAVNTKQLLGLEQGRKGPSILKVMRGSLRNKAILIPLAIGVGWLAPWAVLPMLAVGGLHLASEGARNLLGKGHGHGGHGHGGHEEHGHEGHDHSHAKDGPKPAAPQTTEKQKIRGALQVDFILSAEITVLTLSLVAGAPLLAQVAVLAGTGIAMTAGMYGLIGGLLKMEDAGKWLSRREGKGPLGKTARALGKVMGKAVPPIMKGISIAGTVALFIIGGELLLHGIPGGEHMVASALGTLSANPAVLGALTFLSETAVGLTAGFAAMPLMDKLEPKVEKAAAFCKKQFAKIKNFRLKPAKDKSKPAATVKPVAPAAPVAPPALKNAPDVKAALDQAAQKPVNDHQAAPPANKNTAAPPEKKKPPGNNFKA